jgi:DNA topoisomerase-3
MVRLIREQIPHEFLTYVTQECFIAGCSAQYCRNFSFPFQLQGRQVDMVFSSVAGHLLSLDFEPPFNRWQSCAPKDLYEVPVRKGVQHGDGQNIKRNLQNLARRANTLILWLDCDREGENIAFEVIDVCKEVNPRIEVKRARFSALISSDIFRAINNLVPPNANEAAAVDARQEIDLRIGSSFTRLQTLLLQRFDWSGVVQSNSDRVIVSYGPCQFPTLGLIVQREWAIQSHIFEDFWSINVHYKQESGQSSGKAVFKWDRGNIFDMTVAQVYHGMCQAQPLATVTDISGNQKHRHAPFPLCTLELQKKGSQYLRMSGEKIMKLAEELYQNGFISYPRTETTLYKQGYDLKGLVRMQGDSGKEWSSYANRILENGFRWPQSGGKDDGAHPPIHPTKPYNNQGQNAVEKAKVYDFIVRHFLASCSPDALGQETKISISVAGEKFKCTGLMVIEKNWLEVFPWASWGGSEALPKFQRNQTFHPQEISLHQGTTQPPPRMRETDLLAKMDEYGIGTDATVADHIAKQLDRGYATKDNSNLTFSPTALGESLISAYRKMGLENLWLPTLRGIIEQNINAVAQGRRSKEEVLREAILAFQRDFNIANEKSHILKDEVCNIVFGGRANPAVGNTADGQQFALCICGAPLLLCNEQGEYAVACAVMHQGPVSKVFFPRRLTRNITISDQICESCGNETRKLEFVFDSSLIPPNFRHLTRCCRCVKCDREVASLIKMVGHSARQPQNANQGAGNNGHRAVNGRRGRGPAHRGGRRGRGSGRARGRGRS